MMVFVAHPVAGVHRVPEEWLDGFLPSGFRQATPAEIIHWHDERDLEPPELPGRPDAPAGASADPSPGSGPAAGAPGSPAASLFAG